MKDARPKSALEKERPATSRLGKARQAAKISMAAAAKKLGMSIACLRSLEDECFSPNANEVAGMRKLYGSHFTQTEQGDLFTAAATSGNE